jgi:hypothetical protein
MHEGFAGNLGEPKVSSDTNTGMGETGQQHPGVRADDFPAWTSETGNQSEVLRRNATNGVPRDKPGSLSRLIVPVKPGERVPRSLGVGKGAVGSWNCC